MKQTILDKSHAFRKHVHHYRGRYGILGTLLVCTTINGARNSYVNEFLEEHDLLEKFRNPDFSNKR